jgi:hypothetical protein
LAARSLGCEFTRGLIMEPEPVGTRYTVDGVTYIVYDKPDGGGTWVYHTGTHAETAYGDFVKKPWRTYVKGIGDYAEPVRGERSDVPASTARLPLEYTKRVKAEHMMSIADLGLLATAAGVVFHGYSAGTPYATRDVYLLAVWLGKDQSPGVAMQPQDGKPYVNLKITLSRLFRDMYLRDIRAVLHADNEGSGNTVLSFASIPAASITYTVPEEVVKLVKQSYGSSRLVAGEQALPGLKRDLKAIVEGLGVLSEKDSKGKGNGDDDDW